MTELENLTRCNCGEIVTNPYAKFDDVDEPYRSLYTVRMLFFMAYQRQWNGKQIIR